MRPDLIHLDEAVQKADDLLVVFVSQPLRRLSGECNDDPRFLGFDEESVLSSVITSLGTTSGKTDRCITLLIRPHPRDRTAWSRDDGAPGVKVLVSTSGDGRDDVMASDLVVGMNSILLVEACYLGGIVLSVQPELRRVDTLPTNRSGASVGVYREEDIDPAIESLLLDAEVRCAAAARSKRSARRASSKVSMAPPSAGITTIIPKLALAR